MDDDRPYLEKRLGQKPSKDVPRLGKIAIWFGFISGCADKFDSVGC
jgi:hypothetical protein